MNTDITSRNAKLQAAAEAGALSLPATAVAQINPPRPVPVIKVKDVRAAPAPMSCQQTLTVSFFFDGTGNNLDADVGTWEHSSVARLYRSHRLDSESEGIFSFYLPGIGTLFKDREVNDPGGTLTGKGFGAQGDTRLEWAFARLQEKIADAEARAQNPTNKICWIKIAAFGFSRGAALARAFCRDLQKRCISDGKSTTGWRWKAGAYPIEITFLGLFDTVSAAGLPPSTNNLQRNPYAQAAQGMSLVSNLARMAMQTPELKRLAFGAPGADPAPGPFHGHGLWATDMRIGPMVKRCVHMMAAHENRNSFALDSTLFEASSNMFAFPDNTTEMIYPGVHSDVGGGYRPGEQGTKADKGAQLSLIPLRAMHAEAIQVVPLLPYSLFDVAEQQDFALDADGQPHYAYMLSLFKHYNAAVPGVHVAGATRGVGGQLNQHMHLYYAWRFYAIHTKGSSAQQAQRQQVQNNEAGFTESRAKLDAERKISKAELMRARQWEEQTRVALHNAQLTQIRYGTPVPNNLKQNHQSALKTCKQKQTADDRVRARQDTAAGDGKLNASADKYDQMLLSDAQQIVAWMKEDKTLKLRPHYAALVEAYRNEYERGKGLRDAKIIELFEEYVHNSLAGFDKDETWPSDPRILYVGGDKKLRYATISPDRTPAESAVAAA